MVELVLQRGIDRLLRVGHAQTILRLTLELRIANEQRQKYDRAVAHVFRLDRLGTLVVDQRAVAAQSAGEGATQAQFMAAALRRGHRVDVGMDFAFLVARPRDRPFQAPALIVELHVAREILRRIAGALADHLGQQIRQAAGEMQRRFGCDAPFGLQQRRRAFPAQFDALEQERFGARHLERDLRLQMRVLAENLRIGMEAHGRAAAIIGRADLLQRALGTPRE